MEPNSPHSEAIEKRLTTFPSPYDQIVPEFFASYRRVAHRHKTPEAEVMRCFSTFLDLMEAQLTTPFDFEPYHRRITAPFDYYRFGVDFLLPLVDLPHSTIAGKDHFAAITEQLKAGDNVIFLANHQIEGDPQAMSILLEDDYPFVEETIFVAGERVVTDPLAAPFSMGRNLLCIYSKRYIDAPPERKVAKQEHNRRTMQRMSELLVEGGHSIYVAPSGGRDRRGPDGRIEIAPFDPHSVEMFHLMAKKSKRKTHFYPLALSTYDLLPPPQTIQVELGEARTTEGGAIHIACGQEIDLEAFPGCEAPYKQARRTARATWVHSLVEQAYRNFPLEK